jgi:monovalent cation/hydrogen antiporter
MNDATGLVAFKFALGAVVPAGFSLAGMALEFSSSPRAASAVGLATGYGIGRLRDLLRRLHGATPDRDDALADDALRRLPARRAHGRVGRPRRRRGRPLLRLARPGAHGRGGAPDRLRRVVAGAFLAERHRLRPPRPAVPGLLSAVSGHYSTLQLARLHRGRRRAAIAARIVWVFPGHPTCRSSVSGVRRRRPGPRFRERCSSWAGRACAARSPWRRRFRSRSSLPTATPFPGRDIVIFLAFGVIATTLLVQGTTLEAVIRRLGLREDESRPREERLARMTAVEAGLKALRALEPSAETPDHGAALGHVIAEYEQRLSVLTTEGETRRSAQTRRSAGHRYRMAALQAERQALDGTLAQAARSSTRSTGRSSSSSTTRSRSFWGRSRRTARTSDRSGKDFTYPKAAGPLISHYDILDYPHGKQRP